MCPNCTCDDCRKQTVVSWSERPYRCRICDHTTYSRIMPGLAEIIAIRCEDCGNPADFAGFTEEELHGHIWKDERYKRLQEDHNWAEYGEWNPHAVPLRSNQAAWDKLRAEGRIGIDPKTGMEALRSKDHKQYVQTIRELGYQNAYGEGDANKSHQQNYGRG